MPNHIWSVLCTKASIDRETNIVSLLEIVEEITIASPLPAATNGPVVLAVRAEFVSLWERNRAQEPERALGRLTIQGPTGRPLGGAEFEINLGEKSRTRTIAKLEGLPVSGAGRHAMVVECRSVPENEWAQVARIPFELVIPPQQ